VKLDWEGKLDREREADAGLKPVLDEFALWYPATGVATLAVEVDVEVVVVNDQLFAVVIVLPDKSFTPVVRVAT